MAREPESLSFPLLVQVAEAEQLLPHHSLVGHLAGSIQAEAGGTGSHVSGLQPGKGDLLLEEGVGSSLYACPAPLFLTEQQHYVNLPGVDTTSVFIWEALCSHSGYCELLAGSSVFKDDIQVTTFGDGLQDTRWHLKIGPILFLLQTEERIRNGSDDAQLHFGKMVPHCVPSEPHTF